MAIYKLTDFSDQVRDLSPNVAGSCHESLLDEDCAFPEHVYHGTPVMIVQTKGEKAGQSFTLCCDGLLSGAREHSVSLRAGGQTFHVPIRELLAAIALSSQKQFVQGDRSFHLLEKGHSMQDVMQEVARSDQARHEWNQNLEDQDELLRAAKELGIDLSPAKPPEEL